jgi:Tol biopolymer transport system component
MLALATPVTIMCSACGKGDVVGLELPATIQYWDDWDPAWSPDGSEIAIRSNRATRYVPEHDPRSVLYDISHDDLYLLDTLGNAVQLTGDTVNAPPSFHESPNVRSLSWSPDGRIAFSSLDTLWVVGRDGSGLDEMLIHSPAVALDNLAWSPSGDRIAFSWTNSCSESYCAPFRISVLEIDTDSLTLLTDPAVSSSSPSWSPDGAQLFYISRPPTGPRRINRMNNDGTGVTTLFEIPDNWYDFAWSPCDDRIAFSQTVAPRTHQLSLMDPDGSNVRVLTEGEQASWSPDCSRLAFIRAFVDGDGYEGIDVWMIYADGSGERRVTRRD